MMLVEGVIRGLWEDVCSWLLWWDAGLKTPVPDSSLLHDCLLAPAAKADLSNQLSCAWASGLELNMLSLGLILCCREVIFPQSIPNWNVSNSEVWMCMVRNLVPAPHRPQSPARPVTCLFGYSGSFHALTSPWAFELCRIVLVVQYRHLRNGIDTGAASYGMLGR